MAAREEESAEEWGCVPKGRSEEAELVRSKWAVLPKYSTTCDVHDEVVDTLHVDTLFHFPATRQSPKRVAFGEFDHFHDAFRPCRTTSLRRSPAQALGPVLRHFAAEQARGRRPLGSSLGFLHT